MGLLTLVVLIKLHIATDNTLLCAGIYSALGAVFSLVFGASFLSILLPSAIAFGAAFAYFFILAKLSDTILMWWLAVIGLPIAAAFVGLAFDSSATT